MNPAQFALQIKKELEEVRWQGGAQNVVFGGNGQVFVSAGVPTPAQFPQSTPWCAILLQDGDADDEEPAYLEKAFFIITGQMVHSDPQGEGVVIGGPISDIGESAGRGVAEINERVRQAVQDLTGADGARVLLSTNSTGSPEVFGQGRQIATEDQTLVALCTSQPEFAAPQVLRHSLVDNTWRWEGRHCSDRYDFVDYALVEKAGAEPSTDPADGTIIYSGTAPEFAAAATSGITYTVFARYDVDGDGSEDFSSDPETGAYRVV